MAVQVNWVGNVYGEGTSAAFGDDPVGPDASGGELDEVGAAAVVCVAGSNFCKGWGAPVDF